MRTAGNYNEIVNAFNLHDLASVAKTTKSFYAIKDGNFDISQLNEIYNHFEPENFEHRWIYRGLALNTNCDDSLYVKLANNMDHLAAHDAALKISNKPELLKQVKLHWHASVRSILKQDEEYESLKNRLKSESITNDEINSILDLHLMSSNSSDPHGGIHEHIDQPMIMGLSEALEEDDLSLLPSQFRSYEELLDDLNEIYDFELTSTFWNNELIVIAAFNKNINTEKFSLDNLDIKYEEFIEVGMGSFFYFIEFMEDMGPEILMSWLYAEEIYKGEYDQGPADYFMAGREPVFGNFVDNWHLIVLPFNPSFPDESRKKVIYDFLKMNLDIYKIDDQSPEALKFLFSISCILSLQDKSLLQELSTHEDEGIRKAAELNLNLNK